MILWYCQGGINLKGHGVRAVFNAWSPASESLVRWCLNTDRIRVPTLYLIAEMLMQKSKLALMFMRLQAREQREGCIFKGHLCYLWGNAFYAYVRLHIENGKWAYLKENCKLFSRVWISCACMCVCRCVYLEEFSILNTCSFYAVVDNV